MSFERRAIVRTANGAVENVATIDTTSAWQPPPGCTAEPDPDLTAKIGGTHSGGVFLPPPAPPAPEGPWSYVQAADFTTTSVTLVDIPGAAFQLYPGKRYKLECDIWWRSIATTTGVLFSVSGPASPVAVDLRVEIQQTLIASNIQRVVAFDGGTPTPSIDAANTDRSARVVGIIQTGALGGVLQLRARSEISGSQVTFRLGSRADLRALG